MHPWRLIVDPPQSAAVNMATDEAIAIAFSEQKSPPTLRFYQWSQPSFSIGRFQKLENAWIKQFEKASLEDMSKDSAFITLVRRMTGGRAVLHDREFTYSLTSNNKNPLFSSDIKGTYFAIAKALLLGLKELAIDAEIHSPPQKKTTGTRDPLCFATSARYEITAAEKKLIGSAQRRWSTHFLQHGSLILEKSPLLITQLTWFGMPLDSAQALTLSDLVTQLPSHKNLSEAMKSGFESALSIRLEPGSISAYEQSLTETLVAEKYGNAAWNLRRDQK